MRKDLKVLIVDDEIRNLRILEEILGELCLMDQASDGEEALDKAGTFAPDVILLDGMMPGITGLEVCKQLKANEHHRHIKIILLTGKASEIDKQEGLSAGADGYITKPFAEEQLLAEIERVLP